MIAANQNSWVHLHKKLMRRKLARCRQNTQCQAWVKNIAYFRPTWSNLCLFFKLKQLKTHSLWGRTYLSSLYSSYMGVHLHRATCQRVLTSINDIEMTLIWLYRRHCGVSRGWSSFILLFTNKKSNRNHYCGRSKTLERSNVLIQTTANIANDPRLNFTNFVAEQLRMNLIRKSIRLTPSQNEKFRWNSTYRILALCHLRTTIIRFMG